MNQRATLTWFFALGISAWLSAKAWNPSPIYSPAEAPQALPRPATDLELQSLQAQAQQLSTWINAAQAKQGRKIPLSEVEAHLPQPIFDNPLVDGHGGIQESCPPESLEHPALDWIYCSDSGTFMANVPSFSLE